MTKALLKRYGRSVRRVMVTLSMGAALALLATTPSPAETLPVFVPDISCSGVASAVPPAYYSIELVSTKRVPGSRSARGIGQVTFATSPFGVSISPSGSYIYDLEISVERLRAPKKGVYVVWLSTPNLDQVRRLGILDETLEISGRVEWNKFLVVITLEPSAEDLADMWRGPIVLRGISRSGRMHTLAGHGAFQLEPCIKYGY
ncbi:MAG: hypothetical protein ACE5HV_01730 [Acidobacteriota bacterium]